MLMSVTAAAAALHLKASLAAMRQTPQRKIILSVSQVLLQVEAMLLPTAAFMGGYAGSGTAAGNTVTLTNAKDTSSYGGWAVAGDAANNKIIISGGTGTSATGGHSNAGAASGNNVKVTDSEIEYRVVGGEIFTGSAPGTTATGSASGNSIELVNSVTNTVYGGRVGGTFDVSTGDSQRGRRGRRHK